MHPDFKMPGVTSIDGRIPSIRAAFFKAITPVFKPTDSEVDEVLVILGMERGQCVCAYCGEKSSEWDHLRPIVVGKRPTGFITEIANLVPSCGKCNQSKGGTRWKDWMLSTTADLSPTKRGVPDVGARVARLEAFEQWREPTKVDYESIIGRERWAKYLKMMDDIASLMKLAQASSG